MQFYGQDVAAGVHNEAIGSTSPLDFSRDPDGPDASAYNFPVASNFFSYYMLGNVGFISYSGWCINNNKQAQLCINPCIRMTTSCPLHYVLSQCPMLIRLDFITSHHITSHLRPLPATHALHISMPTGAHSYAEMLPYFEEACTYLATQEPAAVLLQGHWNTQGLGCPSEMNVPEVTSAPSTMLSL